MMQDLIVTRDDLVESARMSSRSLNVVDIVKTYAERIEARDLLIETRPTGNPALTRND